MARDYTKIKAWQLADQLVLLVYKVTKKCPKSEVWGLRNYGRRFRKPLEHLKVNFLCRKVWVLKLEVQSEKTSIIDRNVPRKPRLVGGVKGYNVKQEYLSGKPRPVAGELHSKSSE